MATSSGNMANLHSNLQDLYIVLKNGGGGIVEDYTPQHEPKAKKTPKNILWVILVLEYWTALLHVTCFGDIAQP